VLIGLRWCSQVDHDFLAMIKEAEDDESKASESANLDSMAEGK
jgi:hypothetical protein